ncbi:uncharacterized protein LOC127252593 isoform X2 [Andrographis paniculata]|uniref:uncharacterized protein LOC127252593 isoform X2 n=1 Tax=Andrographis paniculata TaxID=175694 RepID=UPI0021E8B770|nr:uncharacterized protein LOC127252593 isoform X2 [Andrographis paniculata]
MDSIEASTHPRFRQNVVVMRHGDRMDNAVPDWAASAPRPWDPPLDGAGKVRAFRTGEKFREELGFPIHRVFVSPFLRCLETAAEVVAALCGGVGVADCSNSNGGVDFDPSKVKVSVEYGLSEMMNSRAIRTTVAPKDGKFSFDIFKCEAVLPDGTVDRTAESVYKELPRWEETAKVARARYVEVIKTLADRYPSENLLIITHGEGVGACVSEHVEVENVRVCGVQYCAYSVSHRFMSRGHDGDFVLSPKSLVGIALAQTP